MASAHVSLDDVTDISYSHIPRSERHGGGLPHDRKLPERPLFRVELPWSQIRDADRSILDYDRLDSDVCGEQHLLAPDQQADSRFGKRLRRWANEQVHISTV